jgi:hypothetical protein
MMLAAMCRAAKGNGGAAAFGVRVDLDRDRQRLVLRSRSGSEEDRDGVPSTEELAALLERRGWEFGVDHSAIGSSLSFPLVGSRSLELPLRGGHAPLSVLNWLARYRPRDVANAFAPVLRSEGLAE